MDLWLIQTLSYVAGAVIVVWVATRKVISEAIYHEYIQPEEPEAYPGLKKLRLAKSRPVGIRRGGLRVGVLESGLIYSALVYGDSGGTAVAGYLAFKGLTKWAAWQHIVRMPEALEPNASGDTQVELLRWRVEYASERLHRFLLGTLVSLACSGLGIGVWLLTSAILTRFVGK